MMCFYMYVLIHEAVKWLLKSNNGQQINERITPKVPVAPISTVPYAFKTLNGELAPWRLRSRVIPLPEESYVAVTNIRSCESSNSHGDWTNCLSSGKSLTLPGHSVHTLELQADVHSTAFISWSFKAAKRSQVTLKITYSEGYELEPRSYPFFRTKADRLKTENGHLIGPFDLVTLDLPDGEMVKYEPFWFRTFRIMRLEVTIGAEPVNLLSFEAKQANYPINPRASWKEPGDAHSEQIWDVSIRTLRNCMFDGYSDCPFYEQLQQVSLRSLKPLSLLTLSPDTQAIHVPSASSTISYRVMTG